MQTFIASCLSEIQKKDNNISNHVFILPSKRACLFLKQEISKQTKDFQFLPTILSIEDFIENLSLLKTTNNTEVLFYFYEIYAKTNEESFSQFSKWAQVLLHDFNEIDRYNIDANNFFNNLSNIKQLEHWNLKNDPTPLIESYLSFWNNSYNLYKELKKILLSKKIGYQGLIYREATKQLEHYLQNTNKHHYFIGFNALNSCEEIILKELLENNKATVYWDTDNCYLKETNSNINFFFNKYLKEWNYYQKNPFLIKSNYFKNDKTIDVFPIAKNIGQLKKTGEILSKLSINELKETAVVLSDESLLIPLLNSLPTNINSVNITMGLPLKDTPLSAFFESILQLHIKQNNGAYYYKNVQEVLFNNYSQILLKNDDIVSINDYINKNNVLYIDQNKLNDIDISSETKELFTFLSPQIDFTIDYLQKLVFSLKEKLDKQNNNLLDLEYLHRFHQLFNQLESYQKNFKALDSINSLHQVYKELLSSDTLDFKGEPISGLQIMGMLESRALDFKRIILVSVNEGILPSGKSNSSFIPFDLKVAFNLPTYQQKDAVYAYHFFRLLQRAEDIKIIYNTESDGLNTGERSRFLLQLESFLQDNHSYNIHSSTPKIINNKKKLKKITKNESVAKRLKEIAEKGFSPSSLTQYIRNPLDFYTQKVLGLYEDEMIEEFVAANTLGTIVHNTLENFYKPYENNILTKEMVYKMQQNIDSEINTQFQEQFKKGDTSKGKNFLIYHVAKRYVTNFLNLEIESLNNYKEIIIRKIEAEFKVPVQFTTNNNYPVFISGKVDRIDEIDGQLRIIDYKTGKVEPRELSIKNWNDLTQDYKKHSKAFQVLCYAYMINTEKQFSNPITAGIISFKNIKDGFMAFKENKSKLITQDTLKQFENQLEGLIKEINNINIPFTEKEV
ncbi:PD-(D/E)XK nuclease family protein [Pseudofulvibacter geojedonensis]|uniref:PD-(D/E)XK nuclease family protein n=1 Tax=Pseudofulvibacter geojedonensis TaxID=1123758 RepID=A0ABW3I5K9_9FLAO